jgi:hypothetical protein
VLCVILHATEFCPTVFMAKDTQPPGARPQHATANYATGGWVAEQLSGFKADSEQARRAAEATSQQYVLGKLKRPSTKVFYNQVEPPPKVAQTSTEASISNHEPVSEPVSGEPSGVEEPTVSTAGFSPLGIHYQTVHQLVDGSR